MIGYEFELLVREGDRVLRKDTFERFHAGLKQDGWTPKIDPIFHRVVGSSKDDWFVGSDDGVCILEANMPPRDTIGEADAQMRSFLADVQQRWKMLGCTITGVSTFAGEYDIYKYVCNERCIDPDACSKNYLAYAKAHRYPQGHHALNAFAGNHIWLDTPINDAFRRWRLLVRLNPLLTALAANGPFLNRERLPALDGRDHLWGVMLSDSRLGDDRWFYGMPQSEPRSFLEYMDLCMRVPFFFEVRDGVGFRLCDEQLTYGDYYLQGGADAIFPPTGDRFFARPTLDDFHGLQQKNFFSTRIKYRVKPGATIEDIIEAYRLRDEARLLDLFDRICLEVRTVGAQPEADLSTMPALLLGLCERMDQVEALLDSEPYVYWVDLTADVQKNGMHPVRDGIRTVDLLEQILGIADEGLRSRGAGEEQFLIPLRERLDRRETPAEEQLKLWEKGGLEAIWAARDFR